MADSGWLDGYLIDTRDHGDVISNGGEPVVYSNELLSEGWDPEGSGARFDWDLQRHPLYGAGSYHLDEGAIQNVWELNQAVGWSPGGISLSTYNGSAVGWSSSPSGGNRLSGNPQILLGYSYSYVAGITLATHGYSANIGEGALNVFEFYHESFRGDGNTIYDIIPTVNTGWAFEEVDTDYQANPVEFNFRYLSAASGSLDDQIIDLHLADPGLYDDEGLPPGTWLNEESYGYLPVTFVPPVRESITGPGQEVDFTFDEAEILARGWDPDGGIVDAFFYFVPFDLKRGTRPPHSLSSGFSTSFSSPHRGPAVRLVASAVWQTRRYRYWTPESFDYEAGSDEWSAMLVYWAPNSPPDGFDGEFADSTEVYEIIIASQTQIEYRLSLTTANLQLGPLGIAFDEDYASGSGLGMYLYDEDAGLALLWGEGDAGAPTFIAPAFLTQVHLSREGIEVLQTVDYPIDDEHPAYDIQRVRLVDGVLQVIGQSSWIAGLDPSTLALVWGPNDLDIDFGTPFVGLGSDVIMPNQDDDFGWSGADVYTVDANGNQTNARRLEAPDMSPFSWAIHGDWVTFEGVDEYQRTWGFFYYYDDDTGSRHVRVFTYDADYNLLPGYAEYYAPSGNFDSFILRGKTGPVLMQTQNDTFDPVTGFYEYPHERLEAAGASLDGGDVTTAWRPISAAIDPWQVTPLLWNDYSYVSGTGGGYLHLSGWNNFQDAAEWNVVIAGLDTAEGAGSNILSTDTDFDRFPYLVAVCSLGVTNEFGWGTLI